MLRAKISFNLTSRNLSNNLKRRTDVWNVITKYLLVFEFNDDGLDVTSTVQSSERLSTQVKRLETRSLNILLSAKNSANE